MSRRKTNLTPASAAWVAIVISVDHVYLPVGPDGNVGTPWTASSVSTSKVLRRTHLQVPADLARFLSDRGQAEITASAAIASSYKVGHP
jgi:hypothetical protein